ncbi:MAG: pentapeptide repeat-containing protein, partial [Bacteroidales bacterium]|nr:pentapeptide repeat-containing protein [Bacteroidales bacterium]
MNGKKILTSEQIRDILNVSANKNNNLLIFFLTFGLYILISTLGTTDIALLLPQHGFKMPVIDFELDLLSFFVLGPLLLILLHFNILFNHHKHLEKLNTYKDEVDINSIDPSLYGFAFMMGNHSFSGRMINIILWTLLYILPLLVFLIIYMHFSDYHHKVITPIHLIIIVLDLIFIVLSIFYNDNFYKNKHNDLSPTKVNTILKYFFYFYFIFTGLLMISYFILFFYPITYEKYDPSYLRKIENNFWPKQTCNAIKLLSEYKDCYPRLVVTEEEMAKISKDALYIPRHLDMANIKENLKEQKLILEYGTRIDLTNRNLRYADLKASILTRANMTNSQLDAADLSNSHMQAVDLTNANLMDAVLRESKLQSAILINTNLQGASFVKANMQKAQLWHSNLSNSNLQNAQLQQAKFEKVDLVNTDFRDTNLNNTSFMDCNLTGASLHNANITNAAFNKSDLMAADLSGALFIKVFIEGNWTTPSFKEAKMFGMNISKNLLLDDINLTTSQKKFIFDGNVSKEYLTFDGRRV